MRALVVVVLLLCTPHAHADEPRMIRIASVVPDGSAWAREFHAFERAVWKRSEGTVKVKFYLDGKAGDELEIKARIERDQVDGIASGGHACAKVIPSMNVLRLPGLFRDTREVLYVMNQLEARMAKEAEARGYTLLGMALIGTHTFFSRTPIKTMAQLRKIRLWRWNADEIAIAIAKNMGLDIVPVSIQDAARAYDDHKVDGFYAIPTAALAFQWYTQTPFITAIAGDHLVGCMLVRSKALDQLDDSQREILRSETTKSLLRISDLTKRQDAELIGGGVFRRQGSKLVSINDNFREEFYEAARVAREKLDNWLVAADLIKEVTKMLASYRGAQR